MQIQQAIPLLRQWYTCIWYIHVHSGATQWLLSLQRIAVPHATTRQRDSDSFPLFIADENNGLPWRTQDFTGLNYSSNTVRLRRGKAVWKKSENEEAA